MHETRMADVAERAGVSTGMVHYYFDSKRALLAAAFEHNYRASLVVRRALLDSAEPPLAVLRKLIFSYLPDQRTQTGWRVWAELWAQAIRDTEFQQVNEQLYDEWRQIVVDLVERAQREGSARAGDPGTIANMVLSMIDGMATQVLANAQQMKLARMRRTLLTFLDDYVAAP